ncbi:MAG: B12-binding domain-containing radical SAM protein, partial [Campylobacterales bacterium]|nr:B12-binding domain-containing radical SAM protein [Campylobacterales bacterium]
LQDEHVETLYLDDNPHLVLIQVYITNAYRAYAIADHYRAKGAYVLLGGLHVTSLPNEALAHADSIFLGPAEDTIVQFLIDYRAKKPQKIYHSSIRSLENMPPVRRDLIKRHLYLVPNSIVVSRGCPHHCTFCYKDNFYRGGKSFYTQKVDQALCEIERLEGRHLYFLDDHLLGNTHFAKALFEGMRGMGRIFQGAATVDSILADDTIEKAYEAGLRSLFIGFETFSPQNLKQSNKKQNQKLQYEEAIAKLHALGIKINGSFVFGLDSDEQDVFKRTVEWGVKHSLVSSTYHILTPYPGTALFKEFQKSNRIATTNWELYDTRHVVFSPIKLSPKELEEGYRWAYQEFYRWSNIFQSSFHGTLEHSQLKHFVYKAGWKKFEPLWNFLIKSKALNTILPLLEMILSNQTKVNKK